MLNLWLGALAISFSAVFMKLVSVGPTAAGFHRMAIGGVVLAGLVLVRGESLRIDRRVLLPVVVAAACFALDLVFWHRSILHVGTGLATLLANFQVFLLALFGIVVLGERFDWRVAVAVPLALIGLGLIVGLDLSSFVGERRIGVLLGLATAACYASYIIALRATRVEQLISPYASIAWISLVSAVLLGLLLVVEGGSFVIPTMRDAGLLVAYGVVGQVLGWVLISTAVHRVSASAVGIVLLLQPLFAYLWDVVFFARSFTPTELAGAVLALTAIGLGATRRT
jgi:drug/metabolite transporter (DMT)-like permease